MYGWSGTKWRLKRNFFHGNWTSRWDDTVEDITCITARLNNMFHVGICINAFSKNGLRKTVFKTYFSTLSLTKWYMLAKSVSRNSIQKILWIGYRIDDRDVADLKLLTSNGYCWPNRSKSSPTSYTCHQHISSLTFVTNIDVIKTEGRLPMGHNTHFE